MFHFCVYVIYISLHCFCTMYCTAEFDDDYELEQDLLYLFFVDVLPSSGIYKSTHSVLFFSIIDCFLFVLQIKMSGSVETNFRKLSW